MLSRILGTIKLSNLASFIHKKSICILSHFDESPKAPTVKAIIINQTPSVARKITINPTAIISTVFTGLLSFPFTIIYLE